MKEIIITKYMRIHLLNSFVFTGKKTEHADFSKYPESCWVCILTVKKDKIYHYLHTEFGLHKMLKIIICFEFYFFILISFEFGLLSA